MKLYQQGQLEKAQQMCLLLLKEDPKHYDANHLLGILYYQLKDFSQSEHFLHKAISLNDKDAAIYSNLGRIYAEQHKTEKALTCLYKAIQLNPEYAAAYYNLGQLFLQKNDISQAINYFKKAIQLNPKHLQAYLNLGWLLQQQEALEQALYYYQQILSFDKHYIDAYIYIGLLLTQLNQKENALQYYQKALSIQPNHSGIHMNIGSLFLGEKQFDQAIYHYEKAIEIDQNNEKAYLGLAQAFTSLNNIDQAINCYCHLININPQHKEAYDGLGVLYKEKGLLDKAINCFTKAYQIDANNIYACINLGTSLNEKGDIDKAITYFNKALQINPDSVSAHFNLAISLLTLFDFSKGWQEYKYRYHDKAIAKFPHIYKPKTNKPYYEGQPLLGKTIYLYHEQGYGDMIMFCRFLHVLCRQKAHVVVYIKTHHLLKKLYKLSFPKVDFVDTPCTKDFDYHAPIMDLAGALAINQYNMPYKGAYLKTDKSLVCYYHTHFFQHDKYKIGIVWKGNTTYKQDHRRSMDLATFLKYFQKPKNCQLYAFQKDLTEDERRLLHQHDIIDIGSDLNDFLDTASAMKNLDVLISVDTATAHLGGALDITTFIMLCALQIEWRWGIAKKEKNSYWYDAVTLVWQQTPNDWQSAFDQLNITK
ncbi:tetratricopeptide repeat protein [Facilibium subflavum]|uniref:tetratricopeptide repeat protein n=1 Tax=Facilibium subflavum TaxID=2219058 RepID=UPI000E654DBA|nr:tetratricopeptide repeat protein [Facilibium subflavum]